MGAKEKIREYISTWEKRCYPHGLPDFVPIEINDLVPSYRQICIAIMKNENNLESLGFQRTMCEIYGDIKREEIKQRKINKNQTIQLTLF